MTNDEQHVASARVGRIAPKADQPELLRKLRAHRGRLPADFRFDREEANAR